MRRWEHLIDDAADELTKLTHRADERRRQLLDLEHATVDTRSALAGLCADRDAAQARAATTCCPCSACQLCKCSTSYMCSC
jgi:hypothetical protein